MTIEKAPAHESIVTFMPINKPAITLKLQSEYRIIQARVEDYLKKKHNYDPEEDVYILKEARPPINLDEQEDNHDG